MTDSPRAHRQNKAMKWVIILGAIVAAVLVYGLFSEWFGLHGIEHAPDMSTARPTP